MALHFRTLNFRTIDGSNNNLADPTLNQANTDFGRVGPANFADGFNEVTPGPNPREISNIVVAQEDAGEDGPHLIDDNGVALSFVATERHSGTLGGVDPTGEEAAEGMAQLVVGSSGKDTLTGGDLDDTLVAARGHMTMTGGDGADTFVINLEDIKGRHNTVTITDFDPNEDKLQFGTDVHVRKSSDHHGGTLLQVGNETIDLVDVRPHELHHHDWA